MGGGAVLLVQTYWPMILIAGALLMLAAVYLSSYFSAMQPKDGTLEWIAHYDRPKSKIVGQWSPLVRADMLPLFFCLLATALLWGIAAWRAMQFSGELPTAQLVYRAFEYLAMPMLGAAGLYMLLRGLFDDGTVAVFGVLLMQLNRAASPTLLVASTLSLLALVWFLTLDASFLRRALLLVFAALLAVYGFYFSETMLVHLVLLLALLVGGCIARFLETGHGNIVKSLALALLSALLTLLALYAPIAMQLGMTAPKMLIQPQFYQWLAAHLAAMISAAFTLDKAMRLEMITQNWPIILLGLAALAAPAAACVRRRDLRGGMIVLLYLSQLVMLLVCGAFTLPLGCALALSFVWTGLRQREKRGMAILGAVAALLVLLPQWVL